MISNISEMDDEIRTQMRKFYNKHILVSTTGLDVEGTTKFIITKCIEIYQSKQIEAELKVLERSEKEIEILGKFVKMCVEEFPEGECYKQLLQTGQNTMELLQHPSNLIYAQMSPNNETILHRAIKDDTPKRDVDITFVTDLVDLGADFKVKDNGGKTPFSLAALNRNYAVMKMMLETGRISKDQIQNAMFEILYFIPLETPINQVESLFELLKTYDGNMNVRNRSQQSLVEYCVSSPRWLPSLDVFKYLVNTCPKSCLKRSDRLSLIHTFVENQRRSESVLRYLCELHDIDVNERDNEQLTPLIKSIMRSGLEFCKVLLEKGADVQMTYPDDMTCLHYAASIHASNKINDYYKIAKALLKHGAVIEAKDCFGDTPIIYAASTGDTKVFKVFWRKHQKLAPIDSALSDRLITVAMLTGFDSLVSEIEKLCSSNNINVSTKDAPPPRKGISLTNDSWKVWLKEKENEMILNAKNGQKPRIMDAFKERDKMLQIENDEIQRQFSELLDRISKCGNDQDFPFTPILSGSNVEGTKIGVLDEIDFLCQLKFNLKPEQYEILTKNVSNLKQIKIISSSDIANLSDFIDEESFLSSRKIAAQLWKIFASSFKKEDIWKDLYFTRPWWEDDSLHTGGVSFISTINLIWNSANIKRLHISVDLVPTLILPKEKGVIENSKSFEILQNHFELDSEIGKNLLVSKKVDSEFVNEQDKSIIWRKSYSFVEAAIFQQLPQCARDGYKLTKFVRDSRICPAFTHVDTKSVDKLITSYVLKTCLFHEVAMEIETGKLQLESFTSIEWGILRKIYQ
uniref:Mab-21-like nucleotidyltransferase domain-containing protein n=1 Tax=Clytia hemisphaerica TaxID=252671 RepID=A0A7M5V136_9CNID